MLLVSPSAERSIVVSLHHPVKHADEDKAVENHTNDLATEDSTRGDLGIVTHLLTRDIIHGLCIEVLSESSDDDESLWVADEPGSGEELEEDVEAHGDVGGGHEQSSRDQHDGRDADDAEKCPPWGRDGPDLEGDDAESEGAGEDDKEPPVGNFGVLRRELAWILPRSEAEPTLETSRVKGSL